MNHKNVTLTGQFVFIESNTTGTGYIFLKEAKLLGLEPVLLTKKRNAYENIQETDCTIIEADTGNLEGVLKEISKLENVRGIYSSSEYYIEISARVAKILDLWHVSPEAIVNCRNKYKQGQILERAEIATPKTTRIQTIGEFEDLKEELSYPVVVKPQGGSGSVNVSQCKDFREVLTCGKEILSEVANERGIVTDKGVLIQSFIEGQEFSVEIVNGIIIGVTKKHLSKLPWFVEAGHDFPARLSEEDYTDIEECALQAITALDLCKGPVHLELRVTEKQPVIIEVNPRLAGGFIPMLVKYSTQKNMIRATILTACGEKLSNEFYEKKKEIDYVSLRFIMKTREGDVSQFLQNYEKTYFISEMEDIQEIQIYKNRLNNKQTFHDYRDRLGHVIALSNVAGKAEVSCENALRRVSENE